MQLTPQVILLGLVLVGLTLFLENWQPPIKKQYMFIILAVVGCSLGYYMLKGFNGTLWGFVYTSLVFFKDELVKNVEEVANAFNCIFGKDKKDNQDNQENKGE